MCTMRVMGSVRAREGARAASRDGFTAVHHDAHGAHRPTTADAQTFHE